MRPRLYVIITIFFICLSLIFGTLYFGNRNSLKDSSQGRYPLLAKRLFLENPGDVIIDFEPLRSDVKNYLASLGISYSFYFEYLFTGTSIRDGDNNRLVGASLMKIPIIMDLYKAVELGKISLDKSVAVPSDVVGGSDTRFGNQENLKPGDQITLRKAAKITLTESDNTAAYTVYKAIDGLLPAQDQAINNLDIELQVKDIVGESLAMISSRSYASILKCLYYSCFLSLDDSQTILNDLTNSADDNRLHAGVPKMIEVAHKIGSFNAETQSDCGIVYVPNRRYVLCIMLDEDVTNAGRHIEELSKIIYDYVSTVNR